MKEMVPGYYHKFSCIADRCKHTCCKGWEIEIDPESFARYQSMDSEMGNVIRTLIAGDPPHFILQPEDRCPFLLESGLCQMILSLGEESLCDICRLHPRFRNFYSNFFETGLGLCCEKAASIILLDEEPFAISLPEGVMLEPEEQEFFMVRNRIFSVLQDRTATIEERFLKLSNLLGFSLDVSLDFLCERYLLLERLDDTWTHLLESLKGYAYIGSIFREKEFSVFFEQLSCYFVFRHLTDALWDGGFGERVYFALLSCYIIGALISYERDKTGKIDFETCLEFVRMYSSEIEYSEENVEALLALCFDLQNR